MPINNYFAKIVLSGTRYYCILSDDSYNWNSALMALNGMLARPRMAETPEDSRRSAVLGLLV